MSHIWRGNGSLARVNDDDIQPGESFEATDAELQSFGEVIEVAEGETSEADSPETTGEVTRSSDENPQGESGEDTNLEDKSYSELREMAMEADTDEINGRSGKEDIIAYFSE